MICDSCSSTYSRTMVRKASRRSTSSRTTTLLFNVATVFKSCRRQTTASPATAARFSITVDCFGRGPGFLGDYEGTETALQNIPSLCSGYRCQASLRNTPLPWRLPPTRLELLSKYLKSSLYYNIYIAAPSKTFA